MSGWVAGAVVVGSVAGGYLQGQAAKDAAGQYTGQAERGLQYNREMFDKINAQNAPYRETGERGANLYNQLADTGYLTAQPSMDDMTRLMPNYRFGLDQGMGQFNAQANAAGGLIGGNAIQGAQQFAQGYAQNSLADAFNQYQANRSNVVSNVNAMTNIGQQANATTATAASGATTNASNMLSSIGNAQAAGTMGQANAYAGALNNISNYAMLYGMRSGQPGSDIRMKQNIEAIGLLPNGLTVYSWDYKPEFKDDEYCGHGKFVGVMAQEVEKVIPDAVTTRADGFKMVDYTKV
jgi:hypothetical protein